VTEGRDLYDVRFSSAERDRKAGVWSVLVARAFQPWIPAGAVVLDLGCGFGEFSNNVVAARRLAVDVSDESASHLDEGVEFRAGDIGDVSWVADQSVDVVFTSNVLEHLSDRDHVVRAVSEARRVLKPGGVFIAMGPNIRFLAGPYWDFWDHIVPISDRSISELLEMLHFEVLDVVPRFLPYTTKGRLPASGRLLGLYLRLKPLWPLFGRQFLVRARRPLREPGHRRVCPSPA
jgi:dolichol-phosphate mannosyltransferase